ncbi:MAG: AN1-type zinc finger domain-containing protein [Candidatus Hermodarchaeota archaeon]
MTYCENCGDKIGYLPFKCKYCGGTFCKKHRLPENHQCSFELKHIPLTPIDRKEIPVDYKYSGQAISQDVEYKASKELKKYLKRQEKQARYTLKKQKISRIQSTQYIGTKILIIMIISFSILGLIFMSLNIGEYIYLSLNALVTKYTYHTLITSLFINPIDLLNPFFMFTIILIFIMLFITYMIARIIEISKGTKFLFQLFFFSGIFSIIFYFLLRLALITIYPIDLTFYDGVGLVWGGIYGIISYTIFPAMQRDLTGIVAIIPIRMKGRSFLLIIILFRLIPGILYGLFYHPIYFLFYLPELGGILGSYLVFKYQLFTR